MTEPIRTAQEMREACIAVAQSFKVDGCSVIQFHTADRIEVTIRALTVAPREVPECHGCKHWTVYPPAKDYDKQYQHGQCRGMRACGVEIETTGDCSVDAITTDATFYCKGWEAKQ